MYSAIVSPETDLREMLQAYLILFRMQVVLLAAMVSATGSLRGVEWLPPGEPYEPASFAQPAHR